MAKFDVSILEYLGSIENGISALLSIIYDNTYYESTYFYTDEQLILTVPEELEIILDHKISEDEEYISLIKSIIKKVVPYKEIYNRIDPVDFNRWSYKEDIKKVEE